MTTMDPERVAAAISRLRNGEYTNVRQEDVDALLLCPFGSDYHRQGIADALGRWYRIAYADGFKDGQSS